MAKDRIAPPSYRHTGPPSYLEITREGEEPISWQIEREVIRVINRQVTPLCLSEIMECVGRQIPEADIEIGAGIIVALKKRSILSYDPQRGYHKGLCWGIPACKE